MKARWLRNRELILRILGTLLALVLLVLLFQEEGENIGSALKRITVDEFLLALGALMISRLFVVGRWHILLRSTKMDISLARSSSLTFAGLFATNFLPTTIGGDLVRLTGAIRMGYDRAICLASLVADRVVGILAMILLLPFGLLPILSSLPSGSTQAASFLSFGKRIKGFIRDTLHAFSIWAKKPEAVLFSLGCTFGNLFLIFLAIQIMITGLHGSVPFMLIAGLWCVTQIITMIPISINGYGVQELSLSFLLTSVGGLGRAESLTVAVLIRAVFIFASLPGALFLPSIMKAIAWSSAGESNS